MKLSRIVPAGLIAASLTLIGLLVGCSNSSEDHSEGHSSRPEIPSMEVVVQPVSYRRVSPVGRFTGNLLPRRRTVVTSEVNGIAESIPNHGPLIEVDVEGKHYSEQLGILPGQIVQKGDLLLQLDPTELATSVAIARAKLAKANADLSFLKAGERQETIEKLTAMRNEAKARVDLAEQDLQRERQLQVRNATSQSALDSAESSLATAVAVLESQEAVLKSALAGPTTQEISVEEALVQQAQAELDEKIDLLEKAEIKAPFTGVVTEYYIAEGMRLTAGSSEICELLDVRYLIAEVGVPESYLGHVKLQDQCEVEIAGSRQPVPGVVVAINGKVDSISRTFRVRVAIDNFDMQFKAGQFASVRMELGDHLEQLVVPSSSIVLVEGQPHVFVYGDRVALLRSVETGITDGEHTEVLAGVTFGERVVTDDPALLSDGAFVSVRDTVEETADANLSNMGVANKGGLSKITN